MASTHNQFFGGGGEAPIGAIGAGFGLAEPGYVRLDGRTLTRAAYPGLSPFFPVGKMTGVLRALPIAPNPILAYATANHYIIPATSNSTSSLQYSTDGITYTTATTQICTPSGIVATGVRLVAISSGANQPMVSATLSPASAWSTTTGGPASVTQGTSECRLCYATTPGRVVASTGTQVYTLDDGSTAWTLRSPTASTTRQGGAWTGQQVILISGGSAVINLSTDGITYTDSTLYEALSASQGNIASNGSGTAVVSGAPGGLQATFDHGATWEPIYITGVPPSDLWRVQYSGGYFMVPTTMGLAVSPDGRDWTLQYTSIQTMTAAVAVARKGTVAIQIPGGSTTSYTLTESATDFTVPRLRAYAPAISGNPYPLGPLFIKAQ